MERASRLCFCLSHSAPTSTFLKATLVEGAWSLPGNTHKHIPATSNMYESRHTRIMTHNITSAVTDPQGIFRRADEPHFSYSSCQLCFVFFSLLRQEDEETHPKREQHDWDHFRFILELVFRFRV